MNGEASKIVLVGSYKENQLKIQEAEVDAPCQGERNRSDYFMIFGSQKLSLFGMSLKDLDCQHCAIAKMDSVLVPSITGRIWYNRQYDDREKE